ncbi:unnamed protein product [Gongylonema pulchrum]|uniref:Protein UNC80 central region domain-containing protein n=1 Tax=Gongylonema pulchrum TaxID=637853 RepID=A0A3P7RPJ7_9BILA|nr:unnamed protein product [Gongylonema pulchrum]
MPSPPVGQSQVTVVDPPWMPHVKTKVEELSLKEEEQATEKGRAAKIEGMECGMLR